MSSNNKKFYNTNELYSVLIRKHKKPKRKNKKVSKNQ